MPCGTSQGKQKNLSPVRGLCPFGADAEGQAGQDAPAHASLLDRSRGERVEGRRVGHGSHPTLLRYNGITSNTPGTIAQRLSWASWVHLGFEGNWAVEASESVINPSDFEEVAQHGWNKEPMSGVASQPP